MYDLVANITHESTAGTAHEDTKWKVHVHTRQPPDSNVEEDWYQIQDLIVEEINKQMVFLGESYIQVRCAASIRVAHSTILMRIHVLTTDLGEAITARQDAT